MKFLSLLSLFLFTDLTASPQVGVVVGERIPPIVWEQVWGAKDRLELAQFKDKLVILDFWATWCTGCLQEFNLVDSLQIKYRDSVQFILVNAKNTMDNYKKIETTLQRIQKANGRALQGRVVYNDTVARNYFPGIFLPQLVWIKNGVLLAITGGEELTGNNIEALLNGNFLLKQKIEIDKKRPVYTIKELPFDKLCHYSILLKGEQSGLNGSKQNRYRNDTLTGKLITNFPLLDLFRIAFEERFKSLDSKLVRIDGKDSAELVVPQNPLERQGWYERNCFTYELDVPPSLTNKVHEIMQNDLNNYSGFKGSVEKKTTDCYVLYHVASFTDQKDHLPELKKNRLRNSGSIVEFLNSKSFIGLPVINEAKGVVANLEIPQEEESLEQLREWLWRNGFELRKERRDLEFLTIVRQ